jgi:flagellar hook-basal body complex protein FliE
LAIASTRSARRRENVKFWHIQGLGTFVAVVVGKFNRAPRVQTFAMNVTNQNQFSQMRAAILSQNHALLRASGNEAAPDTASTGFGKTLVSALHAVNEQQATATELSDRYQRGETNDIVGVMVERQKASLGFEATLQVRNKLLSAYRDIMNMPV